MEEKYSQYTNVGIMQAQEDDETEETLSLCDLPIYSDAAEWEKLYKEDLSSTSSSSISSSDQDFFEFFSTTSSCNFLRPADDIIFCGKVLIPFHKEPVSVPTQKLNADQKQQNPPKQGFLRRKLKFFGKKARKTSSQTLKFFRKKARKTSSKTLATGRHQRCVSRSMSPQLALPVTDERGYKAAKGGEGYGFSVRRVAVVASPVKPRWYLLMFGLPRLPAEMELSDIRSRQSRQSPKALFRPSRGEEKVRRGKGLWGIIRALGCGGDLRYHYANTIVKTC